MKNRRKVLEMIFLTTRRTSNQRHGNCESLHMTSENGGRKGSKRGAQMVSNNIKTCGEIALTYLLLIA